MNTRSLLKTLGFQEDWEAVSDQLPTYAYDFGNLHLTAAQVMNRYLVPVFLFSGVIQNARSIRLVEFQMPPEIGSFEQGVALISYGIMPVGDRASFGRPVTGSAGALRPDAP